MDLVKFPCLETRTFRLASQQLQRRIRSPVPSIHNTHKDRRLIEFTPTFKRISWNIHNLQNDFSSEGIYREIPEEEPKETHKCKDCHTGFSRKCELVREKAPIKYTPARFVHAETLKQTQSKFTSPSVASDLQLIKDINQQSIYQLFQKNKLLAGWTPNCRSHLKISRAEKRVRFELV